MTRIRNPELYFLRSLGFTRTLGFGLVDIIPHFWKKRNRKMREEPFFYKRKAPLAIDSKKHG